MPKGKIRLIKRIMKIPSHSELFKAFKGTDVVKTLTEKELNLIQEHIKFIPYKKGETIYKQGNRITDMAINKIRGNKSPSNDCVAINPGLVKRLLK